MRNITGCGAAPKELTLPPADCRYTYNRELEGNEKLFVGLHAESHWDWSRKHPVIRISFSDGVLRDRAELDIRIRYTL